MDLIKTIALYIFIILIPIVGATQIISVKQDGTGDYTNIQDAVDASSTGDTVLVWPGTYYETIDMDDHNIVLASLNLTSGEEQYIHNTIIDGSIGEQNPCIRAIYGADFTVAGFTIQNGRGRDNLPGSSGGGFFIDNSNLIIINCIIKNNFARYSGGGIYSARSNLFLTGTLIKENHAATSGGGGITFAVIDSSQKLNFDTINLCSVFNNFACKGSDFYIGRYTSPMTVKLDTFSVSNPGRQHSYAVSDQHVFPVDDKIQIQMNNFIRQSVNSDIYVDPLGDDNNDGLTPVTPLKSLTKAVQIIHSDSLQKNTIFLTNGTYSPSLTGEYFPLGLWTNINIIGEDKDSTILDAENFSNHFTGSRLEESIDLEKFTLINGNGDLSSFLGVGSISMGFTDSISLYKILFKQNVAKSINSLALGNCSYVKINEVQFEDNIYGKSLGVQSSWYSPEYPRLTDSVFIMNCIFNNNVPHPDSTIGLGGALNTSSIGDLYNDSLISIISNSLFINNNSDNGSYPSNIISVFDYAKAIFVNCTFANNHSNLNEKSALFATFGYGAKSEVYNSIFYGNYPREIYLGSNEDTCKLSIYNSLVSGGIENIGGDLNMNVLVYDTTNIDDNPLFLGMWNHPYQITDNSPCINTGTLANIPEYIKLPEYDLAGNPRVYGDSIDMGAYEWDPTIVGFHEIGPGTNADASQSLIKASPNPFYQDTYIEIEPKQLSTEAKVEVYDNYGKLVKTLITTQLNNKVKVLWRGDNNSGNPLPSGIYHVVMFYGDKEVESLKVVKR